MNKKEKIIFRILVDRLMKFFSPAKIKISKIFSSKILDIPFKIIFKTLRKQYFLKQITSQIKAYI